jgi:hypothetical protein
MVAVIPGTVSTKIQIPDQMLFDSQFLVHFDENTDEDHKFATRDASAAPLSAFVANTKDKLTKHQAVQQDGLDLSSVLTEHAAIPRNTRHTRDTSVEQKTSTSMIRR